MTHVHATSIIDASAELADDVVVGPFCVVGRKVRIGQGTVLRERVTLGDYTTLGEHNVLHAGAVVGTEPQDLKYHGGVSFAKIGDHNTIREYVTVNRATGEGEATVIGHHNLLMAYCHVAHNCILRDNVILANSVQLAGHIEIEEAAIVGGLTGVHQFVCIGRHAMVGGVSALRNNVVPYTKVTGDPCRPYGINTIGLRRRGFSEDTIRSLKQAYRVLYRRGLSLDHALRTLEEEFSNVPEVLRITEFISKSERVICR